MAMPKVQHLRLKADTVEDLNLVSGAVQDSILRVAGIVYDAQKRSLTLGLQRLRREAKGKTRIFSGLRFDSVLSLKSTGIERSNDNAFLVLLSLNFVEGDAPGGTLLLEFAGGGRLMAELECLDAVLLDQGEAWPAKSTPKHDL
ncbi:DUF2948 family protein [Litorimonas taeanensis]|uniref:DUF2948 family protein n=1 Tax=Litorimonas taeanensis TaxID=568099 RepID=A0A420WK05_9PROT|nr:DUF2948 family protein [Litorimonas taeanensis]RKQ71338.1 DUF2948 family protein [Litorimonas taeanensis]